MSSQIRILFICFVVLLSCDNKKQDDLKKDSAEEMTFELIDAETSGIKFVNSLEQTEEQNVFDDIYYFNGSGVAVGDVNNDGLPDLYFGGNQTSNKLYINKGNFQFEDVTVNAKVGTKGWTTGVAMADVNNDGWLDIYVCRTSPYVEDDDRRNLLFINNKNGTFDESAKLYGLDNPGFSTQASFFDADNDGDLDMYLANRPLMYNGIYSEKYKKYRFTDELGTHRMFINNNNQFTDISTKANVLCNGYGLSANLADLNQDGKTDIYVCNDFIYPDFMYLNNGDGTFVDKANEKLKHTSLSSMGSDLADFNNDGLVDIFTVDMLAETNYRKKVNSNEDDFDQYNRIKGNGYGHQLMRNNLQMNVANEKFVDIGFMAGVAETDWSWAPLFADFDNDGYKDLFVSNGYFKDFNNMDFMKFRNENKTTNDNQKSSMLSLLSHMPETKIQNYIFKNNGDLTFTKKSNEWGLTKETFSQGAVYADLDNDGDLDLVLSNLGEYPSVYRNTLNNKNYLKIKFKGESSNKYGIGCKVWATIDDNKQYYENYPTRGFQSTVEPIIHLGTGKASKIDKLVIWWPSGKAQELLNVEIGRTLVVSETDATILNYSLPNNQRAGDKLFKEIDPAGFDFVHSESEFVDFRNEPLLPHLMSRFGPSLAVADVNGDGLDDIFIGGSAQVLTSKLYLQKGNGSYVPASSQPWASIINAEHVDAKFFDKDGDGDLDLFLVSGGNEFGAMGDHYSPSIYENDGKGFFSRTIGALPEIKVPGLSVAIGDIDNDGDLDIFLGGAVIPRGYPMATASYLLENDGKGKFTDVTVKWSNQLGLPGIVNESSLVDINGDGLLDLVLAGYWQNISVYINMGNKFVNQTNALGLNKTSGWWNALKVVDIDNDGDLDIIVGNEGQNNLMRVEPNKPAYLVQGDMNRNSAIDAVCFYTVNGEQVPLHSYKEIVQQLSGLIQKRYPKVAMYAAANMSNMFTDEELSNSKTYELNTFSSGIFINEKGKFIFKPFPKFAQISNINDIMVEDVNGDKRLDLVLVGNSDAPRISLGRNDAFNGLILLNQGNHTWTEMGFAESGFFAPFNAQRIENVKGNNKTFWVVANNSNKVQFFEKTKVLQ